ncbi:MAG TPA: hypothetical protein VNR17_10890, partial [Luteimicrobium sp.]|nr:hypothetical protein [Luteimicrobium sp.]
MSATSSAAEQPTEPEPGSAAPADGRPGGRHAAGATTDTTPPEPTGAETPAGEGEAPAPEGAAAPGVPEPSPRDRYLLKLFGPRRL